MSEAVYIDSLYRMGGMIPGVVWLKATRGSVHHPKIVHAFAEGAGSLSVCKNSWWNEALPFTWGIELPRHRVCDDCAAAVCRWISEGNARAQTP
jgi:hypothetical protein